MTLALATALATVEQEMQRLLRLALQIRVEVVADVDALRALTTAGSSGMFSWQEGDLVLKLNGPLVGEGPITPPNTYAWSWTSTATDDGNLYVKPTDVATANPGRWIKQVWPTDQFYDGYRVDAQGGGVVQRVVLWNGEFRKAEFEEWIYARRPAVALMWEGSTNKQTSSIPGGSYEYICRFTVFCASANLRRDQGGMYGPPLAADVVLDVGAIAVMGAVKRVLSDANKFDLTGYNGSSKLGQVGIKAIVLGDEAIEDVDMKERKFLLSLDVEVLCSIENADHANELTDVDHIYVQPKLTEVHADAEFDSDYYVVSGYAFTPGIGLTQTMSAGSAYVAGTLVSSTPTAYTFPADSDTYRDLKPDGTFYYQSVIVGGDEPVPEEGWLRVGLTRTNVLGILFDVYHCATSSNFGEAFVIPKP